MTSPASSALIPSTTTTAAAAVPSPKFKAMASPCNLVNSKATTSSKSTLRTESASSTASTDGIPSRVVKISRNGKVVGSLKISDLHSGHQDKASSPSSGSSGACGHGGNGGHGGGTASSSRLSCGLSDPCSDPIDGSSQSCQLTLDLDSAKLPYKKSLTNRAPHDSGDGRLNSLARHSEKGSTAAVEDPSERGTCLSSAASATAVQQLRSKDGDVKQIQRPRKSPAPSKTAKSTLTSCQHLNHHPQRPNHQEPSDLNDAFNPKSSKNDLVIGGLESHATEVVHVETTTTLPVDTTSCLSNIRSNIFKTTSKNRKNPVQPGFRGDRIVPSSLGMVGTVVSVTKGGQFI